MDLIPRARFVVYGHRFVKVRTVYVVPFPFWRWAVVSARFPEIPGVGYLSKAAAMDYMARIEGRVPAERSFLLHREGIRGCRIVNA